MELDGTLAGLNASGLRLGAGNTRVHALAINRFEGHGIVITGPGRNVVTYNFIGTGASGLAALANGGSGVRIAGSATNQIFGNVLAGNGGAGLRLEAGADGNSVASNLIGVGADGTTSLANGDSGIYVLGGSGNVIDQGNVIAHNNANGVQVSTGLHNMIRNNTIQANGLLGIELGSDGVTPNDPGDLDTGAQRIPELSRSDAGHDLRDPDRGLRDILERSEHHVPGRFLRERLVRSLGLWGGHDASRPQ